MKVSWANLAAGLATTLSTLGGPEEVDTVLILSDRTESNSYAQFSGTASALWAEVVSNEFLPAGRQLSAADEAALVAAGWTKPGEGLPNWWIENVDPQTAAVKVVSAIRHQLRIAPGNLTYESFHPETGEAVAQPTLSVPATNS